MLLISKKRNSMHHHIISILFPLQRIVMNSESSDTVTIQKIDSDRWYKEIFDFSMLRFQFPIFRGRFRGLKIDRG